MLAKVLTITLSSMDEELCTSYSVEVCPTQ